MPKTIKRKLLRASSINGGGFIFSSFVILLWSYLLVTLYSAYESGLLLLCLSVAGILNLADLGVSIGITKIVSSANSEDCGHSPWQFFISSLLVTLVVELVVGVMGFGLWFIVSSPDLEFLDYFSIMIFALSTQTVLICVGLFKGLVDFKGANLISMGASVAVYGIGIFMLFITSNAKTTLLVVALTQALVATLATLFTASKVKPVDRNRHASVFDMVTLVYPKVFKTSIGMFPQMFAGIFFLHVQRFIVAQYVGIGFVAIFSLAYSIATRLHAIVNAFLEVIFPMAKQLRDYGVNILNLCLKLGGVFSAAYLIAAAIALVISDSIVPGLTVPLALYSIGAMFAVAAVPSFHFLNGSGAALQVSVASILGPSLFFIFVLAMGWGDFLVGNQFLIPVAYAVTMFIMLVCVAMLLRRKIKNISSVKF